MIISNFQGLIFVRDPYFNEPGFEKYQGTTKGDECSQKYNLQVEHATLVYAIRNQLRNGPEYFRVRPNSRNLFNTCSHHINAVLC